MKSNGILITLCLSLALFVACKKNDNNSDNNTSARKQLLVTGKWQMSAYTATVNYKGKDTTADLYAGMDECDKDDFMQFANDGKATLDENTNKCSGDQQVENATWALLNNDTKLVIFDSNPDTMDIVDLSATQLKLSRIHPNSSGDPINYSLTYKNIK